MISFFKEINLKPVLNYILFEYKLIIILVSIFFSIGLLDVLTRPIVYSCSSTFIINKKIHQDFKSIINPKILNFEKLRNNTYVDLNKNLYLEIINSQGFQNEILEIILTKNDSLFSYKNYLLKKNNGQLKNFISDFQIEKLIENKIKLFYDNENALFTLSNEEDDPYLVSQINNEALNIFAKRLDKLHEIKLVSYESFLKNELKNRINEYDVLEIEYLKNINKKKNLSSFKIKSIFSNYDEKLNMKKIILNDMKNEIVNTYYNLNYNVSKIFIVNKAYVPINRKSPKRTNLMINWILLGFSISYIFILLKHKIYKL